MPAIQYPCDSKGRSPERQRFLDRMHADLMARGVALLPAPKDSRLTTTKPLGMLEPMSKTVERQKNPHAIALGRLGGVKTSPRKAAAVRLNGLKGGRPKKINTPNSQ